MTLPDRMDFSERLGAALAAAGPLREVRDLLRRVLTTELVSWESNEQRLVRHITERLDAMSDDARRLLALARDVQHLLENASSDRGVEFLLEVVAERDRLLGLIRKYVDGTISRTSLLSFIAEQQWPKEVRGRVVALTAADPESLMAALESADIMRLEAMLVT